MAGTSAYIHPASTMAKAAGPCRVKSQSCHLVGNRNQAAAMRAALKATTVGTVHGERKASPSSIARAARSDVGSSAGAVATPRRSSSRPLAVIGRSVRWTLDSPESGEPCDRACHGGRRPTSPDVGESGRTARATRAGEGGTVPGMDGPPLKAEDWSDDQWQAWLNHPDHAAVVDAPAVQRRPKSTGSSILAAGMLGLERALYGKSPKPEIVIEAEADGHDDGLVVLDLDDPSASKIRIPKADPPA